MMHWGNIGVMGFGSGLGWIFMVIFWALIIMGIIYLTKKLLGSGSSTAKVESVEDILKKRYASGEMSRNEYLETLAEIAKASRN